MPTLRTCAQRAKVSRGGWTTLAVLSLVLGGLAQSAAARAGTGHAGTVTGTVFRDLNDSGQRAAADPGVAGVAVTATDCSGRTVGTATTGSTGAYTLAVAGASCPDLRVAFTVPDGYYPTLGTGAPGAPGVQSGGAVQYLSSTTGTASLGIVAPGDFCGSDPTLTVPCQRAVVETNGSRTPATASALYGIPYNASGDSPAVTTEATTGQVGSIWGNQLYRAPDGTQWDFTSALFKSYSALGPAGLGGVYVTRLTTPRTPNASTFTTIPDTGTDPRPTEDPASTSYNWFHDPAAYSEVYRIGLGDMQLSRDSKTLYVVNLHDKKLYAVPIRPSASGAPTAGTPVAMPLPLGLPGTLPGTGKGLLSGLLGTGRCPAGDLSPFGLGQFGSTLYVTLTCTGPSVSSLRGYVYAMKESTRSFSASPVFEFPLDFPRGCVLLSGDAGGGACAAKTAYPARSAGGPDASAAWNPWVTGTADFTNPAYRFAPGTDGITYPQPELSQVAFQANGDMEIGVKDRNGDQTGIGLNPGDLSDPASYEGFEGGDLLLACGGPASGWTLESDGSCGGVSGAGAGDNLGPGGGQFYQEFFPAGSGLAHEYTSLGSVVQIPGFADLVTTSYDPTDHVNAGGLHHDSNGDGSQTSAAEIYYTNGNSPNDAGGFGKSSGLGEVASLCAAAPVSIDGFAWTDTNGDGRREAGEPGAAGVTVTLEDSGGGVLATTTTGADGRYSFSSVSVPGLRAGAVYKVVVRGKAQTVTAPPIGENEAANFGFAGPRRPARPGRPASPAPAGQKAPVSPIVSSRVPVTG